MNSAYTPFSDHKTTTMTAVTKFDGTVNLLAAFVLLPITRINVAVPIRKVKKYKIPHPKINGAILSMSHNGEIRGIVKSTDKKKCWKHSISIDVSTSEKNINMKLSPGKIHMTGCLSEDHAREGSEYILGLLRSIQEDLDYTRGSDSKRTIDWIRDALCGEVALKIAEKKTSFYHEIVTPDVIPSFVDMRIYNFLTRNIVEYSTWEEFTGMIDALLKVEYVCTSSLSIIQVIPVMINYNYSLDFKLDKMKLAKKIQECGAPFLARFQNQTEHYVTVELPYKCDNNPYIKRSKEVPCHTILIYSSGRVTQSGPQKDLIEEVYNSFRELILRIKPDVEDLKPEKVTKPKRTPVKRAMVYLPVSG